ncbi:TPA: hypothetical protein DD425_02895 [Candidatus Saccharibacteria bacterium]|nr:hypothetical protein [Candidatus Saccharibacteria bacterium]|tara:strand:- start:2082 stop:2708 length:627 start_codon:yes stop_codon:yes gene_type:complete
MSENSSLVAGARRVHNEYRRSQGEGMTQKLRHDVGLPSIVTLESAAEGLLGDPSGMEDIRKRGESTTEESTRDLLYEHLTTILRARLFKLVVWAAPQYLEARRMQFDEIETPLNTLLRYMVQGVAVLLSRSEARTITEGINLLNQWKGVGVLGKDDAVEAALELLSSLTYERPGTSPGTTVRQGLIPEKSAQGNIVLRFVPVQLQELY